MVSASGSGTKIGVCLIRHCEGDKLGGGGVSRLSGYRKPKKKGLHLWLETDGFSVIGNCRVENCASVY